MSMDIDKVLGMLSDSNEGLKNNSDSLMGLAKEVNGVLAEFEKTVTMLDKMHILPALIRGVGKKFEIDVDTPLSTSDSGVAPASEYHKMVFDRMNSMSPEQIGEVLINGSKDTTSTTDENK